MEDEEIGDRTPSQFLRRVQELAGSKVQDELLRSIWAGRLPQQLRPIIATLDGPLEKMAETADHVYRAYGTTRVCSASTTSSLNNNDNNAIKTLTTKMDDLWREITDLKKQELDNDRSRQGSSRGRGSRYRPRSRSRPCNPNYCFFHDRFGERANKCRSPCSYETKN